MGEREKIKAAEKLVGEMLDLKKQKKYYSAIQYCEDALKIYEELGDHAEIEMLQKEIKKIRQLIILFGDEMPEKKALASSQPEREPEHVDRIDREKEINRLENFVKKQIIDKDFLAAKETYEKLQDLYEQEGFTYKANKVEWEIQKVEKMHMDQIRAEQNQAIQEQETTETIAEQRQKRIQRQIEREKAEEEQLISARESFVQSQVSQRESKEEKLEKAKQKHLLVFEAKRAGVEVQELEKQKQEMEAKREALRKQKEKEQETIDTADKLMEKAKRLVDRHEYTEAKQLYKEAAELFVEINWTQQADVLQDEINNLDTLKKEYEERQRKNQEKKRRELEDFRAREQKLREIERKKQEELERQRNALSPEQQRNLETAKMLIKKAQKEEKLGRLDKAIQRYEYLLELIADIETTEIDQEEIKQKIAEIRLNSA